MSNKRMLYWPYVRDSILISFKTLLDTEFQKTWFSKAGEDGRFSYSLNFYVFEYLYDTPWASLWDEAYKAIDVTLYNEEEADAISSFLDFYRNEFKTRVPDSYYINHPKWPELMERARGIVDMMEANNKKYNLQRDLELWDEMQDKNESPSDAEYRIMDEKTDERLRKYNESKTKEGGGSSQ